MLKAILFDMDGVLVDSMRFQADAWAKVFEKFDIKIIREDIYVLEGLNNKGMIKAIFEKNGKIPETWQFDILVKEKREILKFEHIKPFEGIQDCLKELKQNFKLAAVSGSSRIMVEKVVETFFPRCFDVIITGDDLDRGKPEPAPYLKALEKLNITNNECIVVENAPLGITAAKRAGLYCVAIASTLAPENLQHADIVFLDHHAFFKFLKKTQSNFFNF